MTDTQDASMLGDQAKVELVNPKLKTKLSEYGRRARTDGPYRDNLECEALIVGGGKQTNDEYTSLNHSQAQCRIRWYLYVLVLEDQDGTGYGHGLFLAQSHSMPT